MESGRSEPGRDMVIRLAESLDLPLRERNSLLLAAGYAPAYPQTPLDDPALAPVQAALGHILAGHLPYPAIVIDRHGDLVAANAAFELITDGAAPGLLKPPANVYRLALHPAGLAPRIVNFGEWAQHIVGRLLAEVQRNPDERLADLHAELQEYVPDAHMETGHLGFAVPMRFRSAHGELSLITTITTFATAVDITLAELKLEAFLPADDATLSILSRQARKDPRPAGDASERPAAGPDNPA